MERLTRPFVVLACLALVASCSEEEKKPASEVAGGQTPAAPQGAAPAAAAGPGAKIDPCSLFSAADAQALLGAAVKEPMRQEPVPGIIMACAYAEKDGPAIIQVALRSAQAWSIEQEVAQFEQVQGGKLTTQKVRVGGTEATWIEGQDILLAAQGAWIVTTSTSKKGDKLAISKALMGKVLPRAAALAP